MFSSKINPSVYRIISIKNNVKRTNVCEIYCTSNINGVYQKRTNVRTSENGGVIHMSTEEKKEKIRELIEKIEDDELLSFIYKLIKRLMD